MAENLINISEAEWEVMRVVWANQPITGRQIIDMMVEITDWKEGTVKSLINRLQQKEMIQALPASKPFQYQAQVSEQEANYLKGQGVMDKICHRDRGNFIGHLIQSNPLSQGDIDRLMDLLQSKRQEAPQELTCNCPPGQCHCHLH